MKKILVLYGGVSTEHEVSIVTALQVMNALKEAGYKVMPGYISKKGEWFLGNDNFLDPKFYRDLLRVEKQGKRLVLPANKGLGVLTLGWLGFGGEMDQPEAVFPVFHGRNGEDGTIQGLLELANVPYVGCRVTASAVGIDKYITKKVAQAIGIKVVDDVLVTKTDWQVNNNKITKQIKELGYPVFVKPDNLGSSIGISKVEREDALENAIEVAFCYDQRVLVEKAVTNPKEINISIMGNDPYELSVTEQPVGGGELLTFEDKYLSGEGSKKSGMASLSRVMPAPVGEEKIKEIEAVAENFFRSIGGKGIARIDFMLDDKNNLYFNEINTMPGSVAFYLWQKKGVKFQSLVKQLVDLAIEDWQERNKLIYTFNSNILAGFAGRGVKGGKGKL